MYYPQHLVHRFKPLKTPLCLYPVPSPLFSLTQVTRHATWLALSLILLSPWQLKVFGVLGISLYQSSVLHALYQSFIVKYFTWNLDITISQVELHLQFQNTRRLSTKSQLDQRKSFQSRLYDALYHSTSIIVKIHL